MFEVGGADGNNFSPTLSEAERGVIAPTRQSVWNTRLICRVFHTLRS